MKSAKVLIGIGVIAVLVLVGVWANKNQQPGEVMLDSFEGPLDKKTVDFGAADNSSLQVTAAADIKMCGAQSLKMDYKLETGGYMWCARGYGLDVLGAVWGDADPQKIDWTKYDAIGFSVYGNKNGVVAFDVKDSGGEIYRYMVNVDFSGWKEIVIPFAQFKVREDWQPSSAQKNKTLDFPIKSFQWEPKVVGQGTLYVDCVKVLKMPSKP